MSEYVNRTVCVDKHEMVVDRDDYEDKTDLINRIHAKLTPYANIDQINYPLSIEKLLPLKALAKEVCDMIEGRE